MSSKSNKSRFSKKFGRLRVKKVAEKAKQTTQKTKQQAEETIRSISDQVVGTKEHEAEEMDAPRITNDTVAEHREQVLSEARRFIYPLRSRRRIVITSVSIVLGLIALTILLTGLMLYKFQSTNGFAYNISKLVPFPIARVDGDFVPYEHYLFEVRNSLYYLTNFSQEGVEINSEEGQLLVKDTKQRILEKVQLDAIADKLAEENDIVVTEEEIDEQIADFKVHGGIDQSEGTLESVLAKYYNWDLDDLKRVVKEQLINQKLLPVLDTDAKQKIDLVSKKLAEGMSFAAAVKNYSDDQLSKSKNGEIGNVSRNDTNLSPEALEAIFSLKVGEYSEPITTSAGYSIFTVTNRLDKDTVEVSQILVQFFNLEDYLSNKLNSVAHRAYISID